MKKETIGVIQVLVSALLFGFIPVLVRWSEKISINNLAFFRLIVAVLFLFACSWILGLKIQKLKQEKTKMLIFGALHGFIIIGYFVAIRFLTITSSVLLMYSSAIWMVVFSHFILKERIKKVTLGALVIALLGVILVLSPEDFFLKESLVGSFSGLLAGVGFGLVYVLSKTFKTYDKFSLTFWQNMIAIPFVLPLIIFDPPGLFSVNDTIIVLLLGSLFTAVPFILVFKGIEKIKGQTAGVLILLDVIFPILFALLIFREIPTLQVILGGILIIVGSYLVAKNC